MRIRTGACTGAQGSIRTGTYPQVAEMVHDQQVHRSVHRVAQVDPRICTVGGVVRSTPPTDAPQTDLWITQR